MLKFSLAGGVLVSVDTDDPNVTVPIEYEIDPDWAGLAEGMLLAYRAVINRGYGAFGHLIQGAASPIDLHAAILSIPNVSFEILEGAELIENWNPQIPAGAQT